MEIGEAIKLARTEKGMTQDGLSEKVGITRNYISDLERGVYVPSVKTLTRIASVLDIDLNFLVKNVGNTIQNDNR